MSNIVVNGFTVGTELNQVIIGVNGGPSFPVETIGHLREINSRQQSTPLTASPVLYGGKRLHRNIYHDWSGELSFTRFNGDLTNLINNVMQNFHQTGAETYFSIYATVLNTVLGTEDEYLWNQCVFNDHDAGRFSGTAEVDNSIAFRCQDLFITGSGVNVLLNGPTVGLS